MASAMSYQVLARKWRPQTFDDVVGQEAVVKTLKTALETGRVHHAYLFTGSRGVGKTTLARLMAKEIATEPGEAGATARDEIARGVSVDVVEIDGASNNSVDAIREIRENARFLPQTCKFKIFIIDEVHMLSVSAFNALLKILEEPPAHVKFIFATTEPHKLPVTILSRCQRYDFKRITTAKIVERLQYVLGEEGVKIDDAGLLVIARAADGGMRDALSLADQVISFAPSVDGSAIDADAVTDALGLIDRRSMLALTFAVLERDAPTALGVVQNAHARGHDLRQLAEGMCQELRNLTIARSAGTVAGYADLSETDVAEIDDKAGAFDPKDLQRCFTTALDAIDAVAKSELPRMALELHVLTLLSRPPVTDVLRVSEAITRLDLLARGRPVPPASYGGGGGGGPAETVAREAIGGTGRTAAADAPPSVTSSAASTGEAPAPQPTGSGAPPSSAKVAPQTPPQVSPLSPASPAAPERPLPWEGEAAPSGAQIPPRSDPPVGALDGTRESASQAAAADENEARAQEAAAHEEAMREAEASAPPATPPASSSRAKAAPPEPEETAPSPADLEPESEYAAESRAQDELARALPLVGVDPRWLSVVDAVSKASLPFAGHLEHGHVVSAEGDVIQVAFRNQTHEEEARRAPSAMIDEALKAGAFSTFEIVPYTDAASPSIAGARQQALEDAQAALEAHAKNHPVVQKALSLFGGEVRRVTRL